MNFPSGFLVKIHLVFMTRASSGFLNKVNVYFDQWIVLIVHGFVPFRTFDSTQCNNDFFVWIYIWDHILVGSCRAITSCNLCRCSEKFLNHRIWIFVQVFLQLSLCEHSLFCHLTCVVRSVVRSRTIFTFICLLIIDLHQILIWVWCVLHRQIDRTHHLLLSFDHIFNTSVMRRQNFMNLKVQKR